MTPKEMENDRQLDELLQRIGPDLPEPTASAEARARIGGLLSAPAASNGRVYAGQNQVPERLVSQRQPTSRQLKFVTWTAIGLAAAVALLGVTVFLSHSEIASLRDDIRRLQISQASERDDLRGYQFTTDTSDGLPAISHPRFIVVNLHHQFCPRAAKVTPAFRELQERHKDEPVLFVTFDVTACSLADTMKLADRLGIKWIFDDPKLETGMVKLVDTQEHRVVLAALGKNELPKLETAIDSEFPSVRK